MNSLKNSVLAFLMAALFYSKLVGAATETIDHITVLKNFVLEHSEQYIESSKKVRLEQHLKGADFENETYKSRFNILLYHRPSGWEDAISHGVDLMLSGHTHNGQIFPFNFLVKQQFARIKGHYQKDNAHLYVNCGTGTWGPLMRLGSLNEISCFDLLPTSSQQ